MLHSPITLTIPQEELDKRGLIHQDCLVEGKKILAELYGDIWCECYYDSTNKEWQKFAEKLLPKIEKANELLRFNV